MDGINFATPILTRAVNLDTSGRYTEALVCYQEGLRVLMEALKSVKDDEEKRVKLRAKAQGTFSTCPIPGWRGLCTCSVCMYLYL
jgi:hypothetical protein